MQELPAATRDAYKKTSDDYTIVITTICQPELSGRQMGASMPGGRRPSPQKNAVALAGARRPAQQRSSETYERILAVTAETLAEIGFERLSTNIVCERAGLTPPALYRYFPNKYALLYELGRRLMQRQNALSRAGSGGGLCPDRPAISTRARRSSHRHVSRHRGDGGRRLDRAGASRRPGAAGGADRIARGSHRGAGGVPRRDVAGRRSGRTPPCRPPRGRDDLRGRRNAVRRGDARLGRPWHASSAR